MIRNEQMDEEVVKLFNETPGATVRSVANKTGISKTSVYLILTKYRRNDVSLEKLEQNKKDRNIRGGLATKNKYLKKRLE